VDHPGQLKAVHRARRHFDIGNHRLYVGSRLEDGQRLISMGSFEDLEPGFIQEVGHEHTHKGLVLHNENDSAGSSIWHWQRINKTFNKSFGGG
jgi:hypothetical protein